MQRLIFETSPAFILVCLLVGVGYAYLLYQRKNPWGKNLTILLFVFRSILAFAVALLLLGPVVKQMKNLVEKPVFIFITDNSASISQTTDSTRLKEIYNHIESISSELEQEGFDIANVNLDAENIDQPIFNAQTTDIHNALRQVSNEFEGRKIDGVLLVSDGIYNSGLSPLYASYNFPVFTLGIGDTLQRSDVQIKSLVYNKIAYEGNKFPLRAEVLVKGYPGQDITLRLFKNGKVIDQQTKSSGANEFLVFDFQPIADEQGIQRYNAIVETKPNEFNTINNRATAFVEVVKGKKKILLVAGAPHPDIKALRSVIQRNPNYEFHLFIPGIEDGETSVLDPTNVDLAIFYQSPDVRGKTRELYRRFSNSRTSTFIVIGQQTDLNALTQSEVPVKFEQPPRQFDDVTPVLNPAFSHFTVSTDVNSMFAGFPPVSVHFGKVQFTQSATPLLFQKVGSLATEKPLLVVDQQDDRKTAVMMGEGMWRWRMHEYARKENTNAFDELVGKLLQYLSTATDKSRFKSYPIKQEFSTIEAVVIESQVYNDIYEPIYGNTVNIELTDEKGQKKNYNYVISAGSSRYEIGGLSDGVYRYRSSTEISGKREVVNGQFLVVEQQLELQNLTADFNLLRRLSSNTEGKFFQASSIDHLKNELVSRQAQATMHSEETYDSLLNLKWVFFALLVLASAEWFLRKFNGGY